MVNLLPMARRFLSLALLSFTSLSLSACSWFQEDDGFQPIAPTAGETAQVTPEETYPAPAGQGFTAAGTAAPAGNYGAPAYGAAPAAPPAPAAFAPAANEQYVEHMVVSGDSLWKLARTYGTSVARISGANALTNDKILAGKKIVIPTTNPPVGAVVVPAPAMAAPMPTAAQSPAAMPSMPLPSATNPVVRPLPQTVPSTGLLEPVAIPRPVN